MPAPRCPEPLGGHGINSAQHGGSARPRRSPRENFGTAPAPSPAQGLRGAERLRHRGGHRAGNASGPGVTCSFPAPRHGWNPRGPGAAAPSPLLGTGGTPVAPKAPLRPGREQPPGGPGPAGSGCPGGRGEGGGASPQLFCFPAAPTPARSRVRSRAGSAGRARLHRGAAPAPASPRTCGRARGRLSVHRGRGHVRPGRPPSPSSAAPACQRGRGGRAEPPPAGPGARGAGGAVPAARRLRPGPAAAPAPRGRVKLQRGCAAGAPDALRQGSEPAPPLPGSLRAPLERFGISNASHKYLTACKSDRLTGLIRDYSEVELL